ncbi:Cysteine desulfurase [uncultured Clostridium sp.]|uniref:Cysteine desulfurase n=1 Tax=Muricoprocola aceti TaxID=2981772 RepID=A0ABT2SHY9_9FIRM|nr:cysteine desulfurase family protein [Muricoprocola aceti]MCU6724119.1 cysteine desulfurase [Muricoprocola aceti]SCG99987.1 Cysteine desulfurase [uncultured Clostridium sp.]
MEAYLDNSATTRCLDSVIEIVEKTMREDYGNPSSKHQKGLDAENYVRAARTEIAKTLKVQDKEIFFTSGGTESNNWALVGSALANRRAGNHLITTAVEHAAVLQPMGFLEEMGFRITYLPVDKYGVADLEALKKAICEDTILVSMMYVNNELGTEEPVEDAAKIIKAKNPNILFHVDAIQAYGKYRIHPKKLGIDLLSVSGHKIHGPKGSGFLYVNEKAKIRPIILGGGQQKGMRSGTDNVPGIAGLGVAAKEAYQNLEEKAAHLQALKQQLIDGLKDIPDVFIQGQASEGGGALHIVSVSFAGVRSEVLLHALEDRQIYISSGSACSSNKKLPVSTVLKEAHVPKELLDSTVRFSFSSQTTEEEIAYCIEELHRIVPMLRKYTRH